MLHESHIARAWFEGRSRRDRSLLLRSRRPRHADRRLCLCRHLFAHLPEAGVKVSPLALSAALPHPGAADLADTAARLLRRRRGRSSSSTGSPSEPCRLTSSPRPGAADRGPRPPSPRSGSGPEPDEADRLLATERAALAVRGPLCDDEPLHARSPGGRVRRTAEPDHGGRTGHRTARPGTRRSGTPVRLLAVGALTPRKDSRFSSPRWNAFRTSPGNSPSRATWTGAQLRRDLARPDRGSRPRRADHAGGAVSPARLDALYDGADLVVSPSLFEGYGMALAEAMARGLPILSTTGGAAARHGAGRRRG